MVDYSIEHEYHKNDAKKNMFANTSNHSVDDFIAERIVQSMYPKGEKEREEEEELAVFEVTETVPNPTDNEKSIFYFPFLKHV